MPPSPRSRRCRGSDITDNSNLSRDGAALSSSVIPETSVFGIVGGRAKAQAADRRLLVAYIWVHIILHARRSRRKSTRGGMPTKADAAARAKATAANPRVAERLALALGFRLMRRSTSSMYRDTVGLDVVLRPGEGGPVVGCAVYDWPRPRARRRGRQSCNVLCVLQSKVV